MDRKNNQAKQTITYFYNRRTRIAFELAIVGLVLVDLAVLMPYTIELWILPGNHETGWYPENTDWETLHERQHTMVVMHILPPSITVVINLINALLYQHRVIPMLYSVLLIPVMFLGWVASLTIWVLCYQADENGPDFCYQTLLTPFAYPDGISDSINFGFTLVTAVLLALYVFYFALAARDYYTWVKAGSPAMPATIHELEGRRQEEREATELARSLRSHPKDRYDAFREALAQNQRSGVPGYERCTLRG